MKDLCKFIKMSLFTIGFPVMVILVVYVAIDPFKVLRHYDNYFPDELNTPVNKGYITITHFDETFPTEKYDSYILGSSVSIAYRINDWKAFIGDNARCFHLDSSGETLHSMRLKLEYILAQGSCLENVLMVLSPFVFDANDEMTPPFINSYKIDPEVSLLDFHLTFLKGFYNREYFRAYIVSRILGYNAKVGTVEAMEIQPMCITARGNEESIPLWENELDTDPIKFEQDHDIDILRRAVSGCVERQSGLNGKNLIEAQRIAALFREHGTRYKVIIGPRLDKEYLNSTDLMILNDLFGEENVYDYSLSMANIADSIGVFYDKVHYRPKIARIFMEKSYNADKMLQSGIK